MLLSLPDNVAQLMALGGFVLGILFMVPEIALWVKSCFAKPSKETQA